MTTKTTGDPQIDALYKVRKGRVEIIDVPELFYLQVEGRGAPEGDGFAEAMRALYAVSYGAHFAVKKAGGDAPRVMPLEAQWWAEGDDAQATMERIASGTAAMDESDRTAWCWRAMIVQLPPIDAEVIDAAIENARKSKPLDALDALTYDRWAEGPSAQLMHIGPYATESVSVVALHTAIHERGLRPRGRHHEIYLGDPRTSAPEKLRTILRQPVEAATG